MNVTEAEAKQKVCVRVGASYQTHPGTALGKCIGSLCMSWRWSESPSPAVRIAGKDVTEETPEPPVRPSGVPSTWEWFCDPEDGVAGWEEPIDETAVRRRGWCGLAGPKGVG